MFLHRNAHTSTCTGFVRSAMALRTHSASEPPGRTLGTADNMALTEIKETNLCYNAAACRG